MERDGLGRVSLNLSAGMKTNSTYVDILE